MAAVDRVDFLNKVDSAAILAQLSNTRHKSLPGRDQRRSAYLHDRRNNTVEKISEVDSQIITYRLRATFQSSKIGKNFTDRSKSKNLHAKITAPTRAPPTLLLKSIIKKRVRLPTCKFLAAGDVS